MSADDIRIAWNVVSERLIAVHPDDGTFPVKEVAFAETGRTELPGGPRLILGPTLGEIARMFGELPAASAGNGRALS